MDFNLIDLEPTFKSKIAENYFISSQQKIKKQEILITQQKKEYENKINKIERTEMILIKKLQFYKTIVFSFLTLVLIILVLLLIVYLLSGVFQKSFYFLNF